MKTYSLKSSKGPLKIANVQNYMQVKNNRKPVFVCLGFHFRRGGVGGMPADIFHAFAFKQWYS